MSERQANVRDEGTPATVPSQMQPPVAPETGGRDEAPAKPLPATLEDKPQVRSKGPEGRERAPSRQRAGKKRAAPAKAKGPARASKGVSARPSAKGAATRKPKKAAGKPTGARKGSAQKQPRKAAARKAVGAKGAAKKAGGKSPTQGGRGGTQKAKRRG